MAEAGGEVVELYNLARDPGERHNLATRRWETVLRLKNIALNYYRWVHRPRATQMSPHRKFQHPITRCFQGTSSAAVPGPADHKTRRLRWPQRHNVFWPAACSLVPEIVLCICFWSRLDHFMTRYGVGSFSHDQEVVVIAINREGTMLRCLL